MLTTERRTQVELRRFIDRIIEKADARGHRLGSFDIVSIDDSRIALAACRDCQAWVRAFFNGETGDMAGPGLSSYCSSSDAAPPGETKTV